MLVKRRRTQSTSDAFEDRINSKNPTVIIRQGYSLKSVICLCLAICLICQFLLPLAISFLQNAIKEKPVQKFKNLGGLISAKSDLKKSAPQFLVDPIYDEKWKDIGSKMAIPVVHLPEVEQTDPAKVQEALAAAKAARRSRKAGNLEKALIIIEHAYAMAPNVPDILIEMGQVQEGKNMLIEADQCYVRALVYDPNHVEAIGLRAKTSPIVSAIDRKMLNEVHDLRDEFASLQHSTALRRMMRETYFLYVYHTVAIEGNTLSLGQTRSILESGMVVPGKSIREHNEVIGMDAALRFLNSTLLSMDHDRISIDDILEMHRRVLGNADPIEAGRFRNTQVYVGKFTPISPEYVAEQMDELVEWLNDENTLNMDPIEKAAIAHYKLVLVHPFTDGNGRTARLLLNLIMMRSGFPPVILPVETRAEYYSSLHVANLGDLRPFVRYVAKYTKESIQRYIGTTKTSNCIGKENLELQECAI
ncbi:unnamed protein product [Caenorhabditis angaria]|uniref:protein adenylyltransferase n=1 Tax=Caenorhabditis angaria TaxID=860376 RepID=A0A9P1N607_9PELO|nr:unnamed protein product [Caenorhabditis angaria]